jgi:hypothetical protein
MFSVQSVLIEYSNDPKGSGTFASVGREPRLTSARVDARPTQCRNGGRAAFSVSVTLGQCLAGLAVAGRLATLTSTTESNPHRRETADARSSHSHLGAPARPPRQVRR